MQKKASSDLGQCDEALPAAEPAKSPEGGITGKGSLFLALPLVSELAACFIRITVMLVIQQQRY